MNNRLSTSPDWSAVLQPEYSLPLNDRLDAFLRGLYTYYTDNEQDPTNPYDDVGAYGLLNLYTGLRSSDGSWEFSVFARNLTDEGRMLGVDNGAAVSSYQQLQPPDYQTAVGATIAGPYAGGVRYTPAREVGASIRYSFGSH